MRIHRDERGQTILLVAFSLPILIGFIGIATDVGALFKDKRTMQTAADAAAIAGALDLNSAGSGSLVNLGNVVLAARAASAANGFTDALNGVHVTVNDPPTWPASNYVGPVGTPNGYVEVTITKTEPTIFLALFGYPSVTVLARAVATNTGPGVCVFAGIGNNPPTGTPLTVAGGTIQATQCGVVVNSNNSPPMAVSGSLTATSVGVVGDCSSGCGGTISPTTCLRHRALHRPSGLSPASHLRWRVRPQYHRRPKPSGLLQQSLGPSAITRSTCRAARTPSLEISTSRVPAPSPEPVSQSLWARPERSPSARTP